MLIPLKSLIETYGISPKGVLHVGANTGQEAGAYYTCGIVRSIWIEAIPKVFDQLKYNISSCDNAIALNECVSDTDGQIVQFKVTDNNGESSSMLDLAKHKEFYPQVLVSETISLKTKTLDTIISENNIDIAEYEFLCMDLQGAELLTLKGMKENLHKVKYAYLEVNREELYAGCAMVEQLDELLLTYGLKRTQTYWTGSGWGDAFYSKSN